MEAIAGPRWATFEALLWLCAAMGLFTAALVYRSIRLRKMQSKDAHAERLAALHKDARKDAERIVASMKSK